MLPAGKKMAPLASGFGSPLCKNENWKRSGKRSKRWGKVKLVVMHIHFPTFPCILHLHSLPEGPELPVAFFPCCIQKITTTWSMLLECGVVERSEKEVGKRVSDGKK